MIIGVLALPSFRDIKEHISISKLNIYDLAIVLIIFLLTMLRLPIPDVSFDTLNYHLYLQSPVLKNNISSSFFPSGIQTFTFPLPDHIFYVSRTLLGYRGGVLLNSLILIVIFFQVKDYLLQDDMRISFFQKRVYFLSFAAFFTLSTEFILANVGIYMVDLFPIPFLLEILKVITAEEKQDLKFVLPYTAILAGLAVSMKFYMVIFCLPLLLLILFRFFKELSLKHLFTMVVFAGLPLAPYLIYNFTQTNNPIFPYFNGLFHSPFFPQNYWSDIRWGPKNFWEALLWPIYIYLQPNRTAELPFYSGRLSIGYLTCFFLLYKGVTLKKKRMIWCSLVFLLSTFLWTMNTGYIRYGSYLEVFSGFIILEALVLLAKSDNKGQVAFSGVLFTLFTIQLIISYSLTVTNKTDWSQRLTPLQNVQYYRDNLQLVFKDYQPVLKTHDFDEISNLLDKVDYWVVLPWDNNSGVVHLLKKEAPIINLAYSGMTKGSYDDFSSINKINDPKITNWFFVTSGNIENVSDNLGEMGYRILEIYNINLTYFAFGRTVALVKIQEK